MWERNHGQAHYVHVQSQRARESRSKRERASARGENREKLPVWRRRRAMRIAGLGLTRVLHWRRGPALLNELEKCVMPWLLLCMLPAHQLVSHMLCTSTAGALRECAGDDLDSLGVLRERHGRYAAPVQLGLVALYIKLGDRAGGSSPATRDLELLRQGPRPAARHALLGMLIGASLQAAIEALVLRQQRSGARPWPLDRVAPAAATSVTRERHGCWFGQLESVPSADPSADPSAALSAAPSAVSSAAPRALRAAELERWMFSLKLVVLAPLLEELVFRRLILLNLSRATRSPPLNPNPNPNPLTLTLP